MSVANADYRSPPFPCIPQTEEKEQGWTRAVCLLFFRCPSLCELKEADKVPTCHFFSPRGATLLIKIYSVKVLSLLGDHETSAPTQSLASSFTLDIGTALVGHMPWSPFLSRCPLLQMAPMLVSVINQVGRGLARRTELILFLSNSHTRADQMKHCHCLGQTSMHTRTSEELVQHRWLSPKPWISDSETTLGEPLTLAIGFQPC